MIMIRTMTIYNPDGSRKIVIEKYNDSARQWETTPGEYDNEDDADMEIYKRWLNIISVNSN